jgi:hypothetical protein
MARFGEWDEGDFRWRTIMIHEAHVFDTPDDAIKYFVCCVLPINGFGSRSIACYNLLVDTTMGNSDFAF